MGDLDGLFDGQETLPSVGPYLREERATFQALHDKKRPSLPGEPRIRHRHQVPVRHPRERLSLEAHALDVHRRHLNAGLEDLHHDALPKADVLSLIHVGGPALADALDETIPRAVPGAGSGRGEKACLERGQRDGRISHGDLGGGAPAPLEDLSMRLDRIGHLTPKKPKKDPANLRWIAHRQ